jgi:hypothetical protein
MMFLLASLKTFTTSKSCSESRIKILFRLFFPVIGKFSPEYIHGRLSEQFSESKVAFGATFRVTCGYQKAGTSSPAMRFNGRIFKIRQCLLRS